MKSEVFRHNVLSVPWARLNGALGSSAGPSPDTDVGAALLALGLQGKSNRNLFLRHVCTNEALFPVTAPTVTFLWDTLVDPPDGPIEPRAVRWRNTEARYLLWNIHQTAFERARTVPGIEPIFLATRERLGPPPWPFADQGDQFFGLIRVIVPEWREGLIEELMRQKIKPDRPDELIWTMLARCEQLPLRFVEYAAERVLRELDEDLLRRSDLMLAVATRNPELSSDLKKALVSRGGPYFCDLEWQGLRVERPKAADFERFYHPDGRTEVVVVPRFKTRTQGTMERAIFTQRVQSVDWARLTGAYGPSVASPSGSPSDVAAALLELGQTGSDNDVLMGQVCHQGTIFPVTLPTLPFLWDVLLTPPDWPIEPAAAEERTRQARLTLWAIHESASAALQYSDGTAPIPQAIFAATRERLGPPPWAFADQYDPFFALIRVVVPEWREGMIDELMRPGEEAYDRLVWAMLARCQELPVRFVQHVAERVLREEDRDFYNIDMMLIIATEHPEPSLALKQAIFYGLKIEPWEETLEADELLMWAPNLPDLEPFDPGDEDDE